MKIEQEVLEVLRECTTEGNVLFLPNRQLNRQLYLAVNKCLTTIGGKWNRSQKGHVFDHDPGDDLEEMINTGEVTDRKKELQQFYTPVELADSMVFRAKSIYEGDYLTAHWLEPNAGTGNILSQFPSTANITAIDIDRKALEICEAKNYAPYIDFQIADFLAWKGNADIIVMNPPFTRQQDVQHILYAWYEVLNDNGALVSIVSESPFFRQTQLGNAFREWMIQESIQNLQLSSATFKESGTMVNTRLIWGVKRV